MNTTPFLEPLEPRIAPATLSPDARTLTFTDFDGDIVTVKTSKGTFDLAGNFQFIGGFGLERLVRMNLENNPEFSGANITVSARRGPTGGDGFTTIGFIDASGTDLATVIVDGDLGRIEAGDPNTDTPGLKKLTVQSMGEFGTSTQVSGNLQTLITGALGSLIVKGNLREAIIDVSAMGLGDGNIGSVLVGGSIIGGSVADSGSIEASGSIGSVTVRGDILGGAGTLSGRLHAIGTLGNVTIGGSLVGGSGAGVNTGEILAIDIGFVKIGGDVKADTAGTAARIVASGKLAGLTIGGSVKASENASSTAEIISGSDMGPIRIGGDLLGVRVLSGRIESGGKIGSVTIGGSVVGGDFGSSGEIVAASGLGPVKIGRDLVGGDASNNTGFIRTTAGDLASVTIGGSIVGGGGTNAGVVRSAGNLGPVKVGGDLVGGNAVPGGQASAAVVAIGSMASLTIGGSIVGGSQQQSGFVSGNQIGAIVIGRSLLGGTGTASGAIFGGVIGAIKIGGNIEGGSAFGTVDLHEAGVIASSRIKSVFVGGSIIAGTDQTSGEFSNSGAIRASNDIGAIIIKGSLLGNSTNPVIISARGQLNHGTSSDVAIKSISIGGRVEYGRILAGFIGAGAGIDGEGGVNADAQIGAVVIGGDWIASSILAGVDDNDTDGDGLPDGSGDADDTKLTLATNSPSIVSRIASISIRGQALGTPSSLNSTDHYGFVAQQIGAFRVGGTKFALTPGPLLDNLVVGVTADLRVREVAL